MDQLVLLFEKYPQLAIVISLVVSILVAILGVLHSVFVTTANIIFFGFWPGTAISFAGEVVGSLVAFYLYRRGFKKVASNKIQKYKRVTPLTEATGNKAFSLIFLLRLLPFVPSGIVTFVAAVGRVSGGIFLAASSLGKIPSLLLEAYSVNQVILLTWQGKLIISIALLTLLIFFIRHLKISVPGDTH